MTYDDFQAECERIAKMIPRGLACSVPGQPSIQELSLPVGVGYCEASLTSVKEVVARQLRAMAARIEEE